eukprot:3722930-Pyramimonas_sp.AAC.1
MVSCVLHRATCPRSPPHSAPPPVVHHIVAEGNKAVITMVHKGTYTCTSSPSSHTSYYLGFDHGNMPTGTYHIIMRRNRTGCIYDDKTLGA